MPSATTTEMTTHPVVSLIAALRSPLPPGFEWDFRRGEVCALGLAVQIGLSLDTIRNELGIGVLAFVGEIGGVAPFYGVPAHDVTPAMVILNGSYGKSVPHDR